MDLHERETAKSCCCWTMASATLHCVVAVLSTPYAQIRGSAADRTETPRMKPCEQIGVSLPICPCPLPERAAKSLQAPHRRVESIAWAERGATFWPQKAVARLLPKTGRRFEGPNMTWADFETLTNRASTARKLIPRSVRVLQ